MKSFHRAGILIATIVALALPLAASAQSYCSTYTCMLQGQIYSAMNGVSFGSYQSGGFGYNTIAPFAGARIGAVVNANPQVYASQYVPPAFQYQSQQQSQQQYQQQYAPMNYSYQPQYTQPMYNNYGYTGAPSYGGYNGGSLAPYNNGMTYPYATSYPTGYTDAFGNPLCHWSDYPTNASCGSDPQQHIFDPYTGTWY